jgi:1-acyl-sn-glycerol-3-phosphate acyltransferase
MRGVGLIHYRPTLTLPRQAAPRIVVANHPTLVDVTAVLSAVPEMCCLVKASIFDNPLFYLIMKFCGHIRVRRSDSLDGARVLEIASARVGDGSDVLLFPEGTRSPGTAVGPFHAGAFAVAVHSEIEVAKVAIFCDPPVLRRGAPWYLIPPRPVALRLEFLGQSRARDGEPIQSFRDRIRDEIIHSYTQ